MAVHATGRPMTRLEAAEAHAQRVLGARTAKRLATYGNGALYVRAGAGRQFLAWLIDFTVYLFAVGVVVVAVSLVDRSTPLSDDLLAVLVLSPFVVVPLLYGLCFGNGRALGALLTGTQLVSLADGGRLGRTACWAMLGRTLFMPTLIVVAMTNALSGGGAGAPGSAGRVSIDPSATRQLHIAGIR